MDIRTKLRHRLKRRENRQYLEWLAWSKDRRLDGHHIIGKRNDLLIAKIEHEEHLRNPYSDFDEHLVDALENLMDYVEYLQQESFWGKFGL